MEKKPLKQTASLVETLKRYLKARGITYRQLADSLSLSEASVKRMFSKQAFSLSRLEGICQVLGLDFHDLVLMDRQGRWQAEKTLSLEQEKYLLRHPKLLIFLYFLINGWQVELIREQYDYSEQETGKMLARLEKLGLLERLPLDRVRMLISTNNFWRTDGPLWQAYRQAFQEDFLGNDFGLANERLVFSPAQFSEASLGIIRKKIDDLVKQFNQLAEMDAALPLSQRHSTGLLIGFRSWVFTGIAQLRRRKKGS